MSATMECSDERIFPKTLAWCVQERVRSLSVEPGLGFILLGFKHLSYHFLHCLLSSRLPELLKIGAWKCVSPVL